MIFEGNGFKEVFPINIYWLLYLQRMPPNRIPLKSITTDHKEGEQLEDRRNVGESSCNSGGGTNQRVQTLMLMMMMIYSAGISFLCPSYPANRNIAGGGSGGVCR